MERKCHWILSEDTHFPSKYICLLTPPHTLFCVNHAYFNVKTANFTKRRWLCMYACSVFYLIYRTSAHLHTFVCFSPQMDMSVLTELSRLIDLTEPRFCVAVIAIIFNPFFWNVVSHYCCVSSTLRDYITIRICLWCIAWLCVSHVMLLCEQVFLV